MLLHKYWYVKPAYKCMYCSTCDRRAMNLQQAVALCMDHCQAAAGLTGDGNWFKTVVLSGGTACLPIVWYWKPKNNSRSSSFSPKGTWTIVQTNDHISIVFLWCLTLLMFQVTQSSLQIFIYIHNMFNTVEHLP